jgi:hypothetical protein
MKQDLEKLLRKLVKEEIEQAIKTSVSTKVEEPEAKPFAIETQMTDKEANLHCKLKNGKPIKESHIKACTKVLEGRKQLIESMISEKGLFDKIGSAFGKVNPSLNVDDTKHVKRELDRVVAHAQKLEKDFSAKALNTTKTINAYHDAVLDALDKFSALADSLKIDGSDQFDAQLKDEYEDKVIALARQFYQLLNNEKGRIDSFAKTLFNDLSAKGYDKSMVTVTKGTKKPSAPEPGLDQSKLKHKNPPMKSVGKAVGDMATAWAK